MSRKPKVKQLPDNRLEDYIINNKILLTEHIISCIEYAISKELPNIEIFNIDNSNYIINLDQVSYKENLQGIYDYYIKTEQYENCTHLIKVINKL